MRQLELQFKGPIEGWIHNHIKLNYWRVSRSTPREDLLQDAHLVFLHCQRRYGKTVKEDKHFMSLFKAAWTNFFTDLAHEDTKLRKQVSAHTVDDEGEQRSLFDDLPGSTDNDGYLRVLLRQAPAEVTQVLNLFFNAPPEILDLAFNSWRAKGKYRAGGSKQIAELLGLPQHLDVVGMVHEHFRAGDD